jgi:hypothetical protein
MPEIVIIGIIVLLIIGWLTTSVMGFKWTGYLVGILTFVYLSWKLLDGIIV